MASVLVSAEVTTGRVITRPWCRSWMTSPRPGIRVMLLSESGIKCTSTVFSGRIKPPTTLLLTLESPLLLMLLLLLLLLLLLRLLLWLLLISPPSLLPLLFLLLDVVVVVVVVTFTTVLVLSVAAVVLAMRAMGLALTGREESVPRGPLPDADLTNF